MTSIVKIFQRKKLHVLYIVLFLSINAIAQTTAIPYLQKKGTTQELIVDGKPFLVLGGEPGNSTASGLDYMQPFWNSFKAMHLNTILCPVYWELTEPEEGKFDFSLVDSIVFIPFNGIKSCRNC